MSNVIILGSVLCMQGSFERFFVRPWTMFGRRLFSLNFVRRPTNSQRTPAFGGRGINYFKAFKYSFQASSEKMKSDIGGFKTRSDVD